MSSAPRTDPSPAAAVADLRLEDRAPAATTAAPVDMKDATETPGVANPDFQLSELYKEQGNAHFRENRYGAALTSYTMAIEASPNSPVYYSNRAFCHIRLENYGLAVQDASKAIQLDGTFVKAYYRRGAAYIGIGKYRLALRDFERVCKIHPKNAQAVAKYRECKKMATEAAFAKAIESERTMPPSQLLDWRKLALPSSYDGPDYPETGITREFVLHLLQLFRAQQAIPKRFAVRILIDIIDLLRRTPTLVDVQVAPDETFTVCGDIHGQFYDLLNIWEMNGYPDQHARYLFNGDYVDRGSFSAECIFALFAFKLLDSSIVTLTRGNHESRTMNSIYGFQGEILHKYDGSVYDLFCEAFCLLPLAAVLHGDPSEENILVLHGGLFSSDDVTLDDIRAVNRDQQPPDSGLMCELLWSDPQPLPGRAPSKRGVGVAFGPDVTHAFLKRNHLKMLVRSHEVKDEGYEVECQGKLVTVFSAPKYCDQLDNKGAFIHFNYRLEPQYTSFVGVAHPAVRPMAYARPMLM